MQTALVNYDNWTLPYEVALKETRDELSVVFNNDNHADRFISALWLAFRKNPQLQACTQESIHAAIVALAQTGLDITQPGEVWLIPMENTKRDERGKITGKVSECVVWDGYIGRVKLAKQNPDVEDVWAEEVRQHDTYKFRGYAEAPLHEYPDGFSPRGDLLGVYAVARFRSGYCKCIQMSKDEIIKFRDQYSRAARSAVWQETYERWGETRGEKVRDENRGFAMMAKKTVLSQLCHPRHITMPRHAASLIAEQEAAAQRLTVTNESLQPQAPLVAREESAHELLPETPGSVVELNPGVRKLSEAEAEHKQELLAEIKQGYHEVVCQLLIEPERTALCRNIFGVAGFQYLQTVPLDDLLSRMHSWRGKIESLKQYGVSDAPKSPTVDFTSQEGETTEEDAKPEYEAPEIVTISKFLDELAPHCEEHGLSIGRILGHCCDSWGLSGPQEFNDKQRQQLKLWITTEGGRKNLAERMGT